MTTFSGMKKKLEKDYLADSLKGLTICCLIAPAKPPALTPFLSLAPSIIFLNNSVVDNIPNELPSIAFPNKPKGPNNKEPNKATDILGIAFFIAAFLSLFNKPPLSPNKKFLASSLFLI